MRRLALRSLSLAALVALALAGLTLSASAHVGGHGGGLADGLAHPFYGIDHVLAMIAVGLWAAHLGRAALWLLPATFPMVMIVGALIGRHGLPFPWTETALAGSVIALGAMIACALRPSLIISAALVALFALVHGYEHGATLPDHAAPLYYGAGFVLATLILHVTGIGVGLLTLRPSSRYVARASGAVIAAIGAIFLIAA